MNLPLFIARKITTTKKAASFSKFIINLATVATALSVAVMIIAVAVVLGFKQTVKEKLFTFWGGVEVSPFVPDPSIIAPAEPFEIDPKLIATIKSSAGVTDVQPFALKPGILNSGNTIQGIQMKGITSGYPLESNESIIFEGKKINFAPQGYSADVILGQSLLNKLDVKIGDSLTLIFVDVNQETPRMRRLLVKGSFSTGMEDIDQNFLLCDINLIRRLSNWDSTAVNAYQVSLQDYNQAEIIANNLYQQYLTPPMSARTVHEIYPNLMSWLALMDTNTYLILGIMAVVAVINLSTALLIFVLERTNMIGILKALGMNAGRIQKIFLFHASNVALKGVFWGSLLGIAFCLTQHLTHLVPLDESAYYMSYVPIKLVPWHVLVIGLGTTAFCFLVLTIPAFLVNRISIVKAVRFK